MPTRMRMYLKPRDASVGLMLTLLLVDTALAITYLSCQFSYVINGNYDDSADKIVQLLIAFGVTGAILCYCIADAIRFL